MNTDTSEDIINNHLVAVYSEIADAAKRQDLSSISRLVSKAGQLEELRNQHRAVQGRIASLRNTGEDKNLASNERDPLNLREFAVEVTEGMKRQNLFTLTSHVKRGRIKTGEQLIIEALPSGKRFQTELLDQGNRLRARGEIAQFYRDANVNDGDYVLLTEVAPGIWTLRKAPPRDHSVPNLG
jgi:hypothetical protein